MSVPKRKRASPALTPVPRREIAFHGALFWTLNQGAIDPMTDKWVWFVCGGWAHDQDDGLTTHCCLAGAISSRFGMNAHPGLHLDGINALSWAESEYLALEAQS